MWYKKAAEKWGKVLPVGNERIGAMIFGGVEEDKTHFSVQNLDVLNFEDSIFDHVICSVVLHFAQNT